MELASYILGKKAGGGETPTGTIEITQNGITNVSSYASADVNVQPNLESKSVTITENGETTVTATSGKDGLSSVSITTNVSGGGGLDWSAIGYSEEPPSIQAGYNYAIQMKAQWEQSPPSDLAYLYLGDYNLVYLPLLTIDSSITNAHYTFSGCINLKQIPAINFNNITELRGTFGGCESLTDLGNINISNVTSMQETFVNCKSLKTIPLLDFSNVTNMQQTFAGCASLISIPQLDISKVEYMAYTFSSCDSLTTIPELDCSSVRSVRDMLSWSPSITTLGGFKNLGMGYYFWESAHSEDYMLNLSDCTNLTHDSLMNVINKLYDLTIDSIQEQDILLGTDNYAKLTSAEIAIATNKGWNVREN